VEKTALFTGPCRSDPFKKTNTYERQNQKNEVSGISPDELFGMPWLLKLTEISKT